MNPQKIFLAIIFALFVIVISDAIISGIVDRKEIDIKGLGTIDDVCHNMGGIVDMGPVKYSKYTQTYVKVWTCGIVIETSDFKDSHIVPTSQNLYNAFAK